MSPPQDTTTSDDPPPPDEAGRRLAALRAEIDRLDDQLHDQLMLRAAIVEELAASGAKRGAPIRPARESQILRRLLARHRGGLPKAAIVAIWRELFSATIAMQGPFSAAVWTPEAGSGHVALAREHFGGTTPMRWMRSTAQVVRAVGEGEATVGVLPLPQDDPAGITETGADPWWISLMRGERPGLFVISRLPFVTLRREGSPLVQAMVIAALMPEPSNEDRSLVGFASADNVSRARIAERLAACGLSPNSLVLYRRDMGGPERGPPMCLAEVEGFVIAGDPRLEALVAAGAATDRPVVLGSWPVPPPETIFSSSSTE